MAGKEAKTRLICSSLPSFCFQMPKAIEEIIQHIPAGKWKGHLWKNKKGKAFFENKSNSRGWKERRLQGPGRVETGTCSWQHPGRKAGPQRGEIIESLHLWNGSGAVVSHDDSVSRVPLIFPLI